MQIVKRLLSRCNEIFHLRQNHYNLRNFNIFATDNPRNKYLLNSSVTAQKMKFSIKDFSSK